MNQALSHTDYIPTMPEIVALQTAMSNLPQIVEGLVTENYFVKVGSVFLYCRKATIPAGRRLVGRTHKHGHFFILTCGTMQVWTDKTYRIVEAGDVVSASSGVKRVLVSLTDCVGMNLHITTSDNMEEIEKELLEEDETSLFDIYNNLKAPRLIQGD